MKPMSFFSITLVAATLSGASLVVAPSGAHATDDFQDDSLALDHFTCDADLLAGNYGFNADGAIIRPNHELSYTAVGLLQFRADGTVTLQVTENLNGVPEPVEDFEGTFQVNPDCTGTAEFADLVPPLSDPITWVFVAVDNASEVSLATTVEGTEITADAVRTFQQ